VDGPVGGEGHGRTAVTGGQTLGLAGIDVDCGEG
jgi:hypothetical protein